MSKPHPLRDRLPGFDLDRALYVLDVSGYLFRAYFALPPLSSPSGEPTHAVHGFANMLMKLLDDHAPSHFAAVMDAPGRTFRDDMYDQYKANRPAAPDDLKSQIVRCHELLDAMEIPVLLREGFEADDLIASLNAQAVFWGRHVVIVSSDKDLLQLVSDTTCMYDSMRDRVFDAEGTHKKMGVPPHQVRDYLALVGDSSDNVPGVASVGPKTAKALLEQFGTLEQLYEGLHGVQRDALRKKLADQRDQAFLSQRLVTLRNDLQPVQELDHLRFSHPEAQRGAELFASLGMKNLRERFLQWAGEPTPTAQDPAIAEPQVTPEVLDHNTLVSWLEERATDAVALRVPHVAPRSVPGNRVEGGSQDGIWIGAQDGTVAQIRGEIDETWTVFLDHLHRHGPVLVVNDLKSLHHSLAPGGLQERLRGLRAFDLGLASYVLDSGKGDHDLASLASRLLPQVAPDAPGPPAGTLHMFAVFSSLHTRLQSSEAKDLYYLTELPLALCLARVETTGVRVDGDILRERSAQMSARIEELQARCIELAGKTFNVNSPRQLETILFDDLGLPVLKKTKTARSTSHEVLEELAGFHELPKLIMEYRSLTKLKNTYLDALPTVIHAHTGRIHTSFNQTVAATGRLSSSDPNLQNIPIRTPEGRAIRSAFVPRKGWIMTSADYSQIELRVLAHLSGDPELVAAFDHAVDVHTRTASALFDVDEAQVTREQRAQGKTVNFAVIYGQTQFALARNLRIERHQAQRYIDAFFERYAGVKRHMDEVLDGAHRDGFVRTMMGRTRWIPDLKSKNRNLRLAAERMATNTPIQGTAADIMKVSMVRIGQWLREAELRSQLLLTVHDELVFESPPDEVDTLKTEVVRIMRGGADLRVPLEVDVGSGATWDEAH